MTSKTLIATRTELHRIALDVLAAELEGTTELITLRITPGGFGQPERLVDGEQLRTRVDGTSLVVQRGEHETWQPIDTLTAADAVEQIATFFSSCAGALDELRRRHTTDGPTIVQLFPHHFDVAITLNEVNLGGSPGDDDHDQPYLYVGPWVLHPHPMWNESWGVSMRWTEDLSHEAIVAFFEAGVAAARLPS